MSGALGRVLVTGASGFIGSHLVPFLIDRGYAVRAGCRRLPSDRDCRAEWFPVGEVNGNTDWRGALEGITYVVHLAGVAHRIGDDERELARTFTRVNVDGTRRLAEAASEANVRRFVFLSSVKALPEPGRTEPTDAYGKSKLRAESLLAESLRNSPCDWCVLRPVLVYGPGNRGNMQRLLGLMRSGVPLPFRSIKNRRSVLYVNNLVDVIERALNNPGAARQAFVVCDDQTVSTPELVDLMAAAEGLRVRMWPAPLWLLRVLARLGDGFRVVTGRSMGWDSYSVDRLCGSLEFSNGPLQEGLRWKAPFTTQEGLRRTMLEQRTAKVR